MTRLDYLISQTLGRSPYDDEIICNEDPLHVPGTVRTGQQYDDRGRPMNRQTNQQTRNLTRAQNEVMAAAGIIESYEVAKAKDAATKKGLEAREDDIQKAYRRRAYGQIALTCGVWGACGLRRRIELYRDCSQHPLMYLIQREHQTSSWLKMFGAGLPALMLNRAIGNVAHFININPFSPTTKTIVTHATNYVMFHYKYFAILQQLGLVPSTFPYFVVPPLSFMVPFSSTSPFYLPTLPITLDSSAILTFASQTALVVAPVIFLQLWYRISNYIISEIYDPIYNSLPYPSNVPAAQAIERAELERREKQETERRAHQQASNPQSEFIENLDAQGILDGIVGTRDNYTRDDGESDTDTDNASTTTWDVSEYNELNPPPRPSNPTPTSDPSFRDSDTPEDSSQSNSAGGVNNDDNNLRGGSGSQERTESRERRIRPRRDSYASTSTSLDGEATTTLITFDVEATDEPMPTSGSYSAELRQAPDENTSRGLRGGGRAAGLGEGVVEYNVTAMSIMPAHLCADGVTVLLSTALTVVLESIMVRAVAASWLGKKSGGGSWGGSTQIWPVFARNDTRLPWYGVGNIGIVFLGDLVMTGVIWFGCMGCMWMKDKVFSGEVEGREKGKGDGDVKVHED